MWRLKELGVVEPRARLWELMGLEVGEVGINCGNWGGVRAGRTRAQLWDGLGNALELEFNCVG